MGVDKENLRRYNRQLILNHVRKYEPMSRSSLAKELNLSRSTVGSIVDEIVDDKYLYNGKKLQPAERGGKPATEVHFNVDAGCVIGIDLGRTHLRIYLTNLAADRLDMYESRFDKQDNWMEGLSCIADEIERLLKKNQKDWSLVRGIGFGMPGSPDSTLRKLKSAPLPLASWVDKDIPNSLRAALKLREDCPIYLDNDANLGALGESRYGAGRGIENLVYIKLSTGIGAGLILNGQLFRGNSGTAGELGHVKVGNDGPLCPGCGEQGCLEALAGLGAIVRNARERSASDLIRSHKELAITPERMAEVITEAEAGDAACLAVLKDAGELIGMVIGGLINVYNPARILLDGGIIRPGQEKNIAINEPLLASLKKSTKKASFPDAWKGTKIAPGKLEDHAVGLGAVATVLDRDEALKMPDDMGSKLSGKALQRARG